MGKAARLAKAGKFRIKFDFIRVQGAGPARDVAGKSFLFNSNEIGGWPTTYLSGAASLSFSPRPWVVA